MRFTIAATLLFAVLVTCLPAFAQFDPAPTGKGPRLDKPFTQRYQVGVTISSRNGPCRGMVASVPIPQDWPEQQVKVETEEISKSVRSVRTKSLGDGVKQMLVSVPIMPAGQIANALITYEITRYTTLPPEDTSIFQLPKKLVLAERRYLGHSPLIESRHGEIRSQAKEILAGHQDAGAWQQVELIYDWVRDNVQKQNGKLKGGLQTMRDGHGNEEDITSLFIALCRAADVPARTVWIPDSCYAEFLLSDDDGENHWIPCRPAGDRAFGGINCEFPILQKGDNFKVPQRREPVRFVPEFMTGTGGRPSVEFVRMPLGR